MSTTEVILPSTIKYTDSRFEFPIMIYKRDQRKSKDNAKLRELGIDVPDEDEEVEDEDGVECMIAYPHEYIIGWADAFSRERTVEDVRKYGFDMTEVLVQGELEPLFCTWPKEVFKKKLNEHVFNLTKSIADDMKNQLEKFIKEKENDVATQSNDSNNKNRGWFGRLRLYINRLFSRA